MEDWWPDDIRFAGAEHLDAEFVAGYDTKARFDPASDVALLQRYGLDDDSTLIDLGAGTGTLSVAVAATGASVVAIDPSPAMVDAIAAGPVNAWWSIWDSPSSRTTAPIMRRSEERRSSPDPGAVARHSRYRYFATKSPDELRQGYQPNNGLGDLVITPRRIAASRRRGRTVPLAETPWLVIGTGAGVVRRSVGEEGDRRADRTVRSRGGGRRTAAPIRRTIRTLR